MQQQLDMRGKQCPIPVVEANRAFDEAKEALSLTVTVDNETAAKNLARMAAGRSLAYACEALSGGCFRVVLSSAGAVPAAAPAAAECPACAPAGGCVVALSADTMGAGSEELGRILMKGFVYALTGLAVPPEAVLCYNGGVRLSTENPDTVRDLRALEEKGTRILSCGTCLNYYGLTEQLAVGSVTDMYTIAETLSNAGKVLRP